MQRVPDPGFRVDTGPLKFGGDWCGYFMRGDNAGIFSDYLRRAAACCDKDPMAQGALLECADGISKCHEEFGAK